MIYLIYAFVAYIVAVIDNYYRQDLGEAIFIGVLWPITLPFFLFKLLVEWGTDGLMKLIDILQAYWKGR